MNHLIISKNKKESFSKVDKAQKSILFNNQVLDFYKDTLFTPYSLIYYLRNNDMNENNEFEYQIYDSGKLKDVKLKI